MITCMKYASHMVFKQYIKNYSQINNKERVQSIIKLSEIQWKYKNYCLCSSLDHNSHKLYINNIKGSLESGINKYLLPPQNHCIKEKGLY